MRLRGGATYVERWNSEAFEREALEIAEDALLETGETLVAELQEQELHTELPYLTGALASSLRLAPVGYSHNDLDLVAEQGYGKGATTNLSSASGRTRPVAMEKVRKAASPPRSLGAAVERDELVSNDGNTLSMWVGSFLPYSYFQHQGFYHRGVAGAAMAAGTTPSVARESSFIPGRPYLSRLIDLRGPVIWPQAYRRARGRRLLRGA